MVLLVAMWTPPLVQQLTRRPGNIAAFYFDLRRPAPRHPLEQAWAVVATELARVPAFLTGQSPRAAFLLPPLLPRWMGWLAVVALVAAGVVAARRVGGRRDRVGLSGAVLAGALVASALAGTALVRGLIFTYLVQWASAVAILVWIVVIVVVARAVASRSPRAGLPRGASTVAGVGLVLVLVGLSLTDVNDRTRGRPDVRDAGRVTTAWVHSHGFRSVDLDVVPLAHGQPLGLLEPTSGLCLELDRGGVAVRPPKDLAFPAGNVLPAPRTPTQAQLLVGQVGNLSAVPGGYELVTQRGGVVVFGRALPG